MTIIQTFIIDQIEKKLKNWEKIPIHSKNPRLGLFSPFWGKTFSKNLALSCTTPHGPLTPCWVPGKTKEPIPKTLPKRRTDRPYSFDPCDHGQGSYKKIIQLKGIAVDNKNKI